MIKRDYELLINYINDVLYHPDEAHLDPAALGDECRTLGESVKRLSEWALEANRYAGAIANGRQAEFTPPGEENVFAGNIRNIQMLLEHRTAQIKQIVDKKDGWVTEQERHDFDTMVTELRKRTSALENERNLFIQFTESASERIVVLDEETGDILFGNKVARNYLDQTRGYIDDATFLNTQSQCSFQKPYSQWTHTVTHPDDQGELITEYFQVHSIYIIWENRGAIAHMFSNITEMQKIQERAARDPLTGVFNRGYAMEYINRLYAEGKPFSLAFVDVDYLKYCNDTFGHHAGDAYLIQIVRLLENIGHGETVCRTGGDEFLVISEALHPEALTCVMEHTRESLSREYFGGKDGIHKSFSYGIAGYFNGKDITVERLLSDADERMYQDKLQNKRKNHLSQKDDRLV